MSIDGGVWRSIDVSLNADVNGYIGGLERSSTATVAFGEKVRAATTNVDRLDSASKKLGKFGSTMTRDVTLPMAAAGAVAVVAADRYNTTFTKMVSLAGVASTEVDGLKKTIDGLAHTTGKSPQELAEAFYFIRSAGLEGQQAIDALTVSAKASALGMGDTAQVADAVTSALIAYKREGLSAAQATDVLAAAVTAGKGEASEFAPQLGRLLPVAEQLGIGFDEVSGSLAYLTKVGGDTSRASSQLFAILAGLVRPSQQGADELDRVGLSADKLRQVVATQGLLPALQLLQKAFQGNGEAMGRVFEDRDALVAVFNLLNNGGREAKQVLDEVSGSAGLLGEKFDGLSKTDEFKLTQDIADLKRVLIDVGDELIPIVGGVAKGFAGVLGVIDRLPGPLKATLFGLAAIAAIIGPAAKGLGLLTGGLSTLVKVAKSEQIAGLVAKLRGVETGAEGASGAVSGLLASMGPGGVAAAVAGLSVLSFTFLKMQSDARHAKDNIRDMQDQIANGGSPAQVAITKLAKTLAGQDGGFSGLGGSSDHFRKMLDEVGLSATEAAKAITGPEREWKKLKSELEDKPIDRRQLREFITNLEKMREQSAGATDAARIQKRLERELGVQTDDTASSTKGLTDATIENTAAADANNNKIVDAIDKRRQLFDAQQAERSAEADTREAVADLAKAQAAARGDSDEYRAAKERIVEAERSAADAARNTREAQQALTEAYKEAQDKLDSLERSRKGAIIAEERAKDRLAEARQQLKDTMGDPTKTPAERRDAYLSYLEAQLGLQDAQKASKDSAEKLDEAQRKGIEGSDQVVAAKQRLTDALDAQRQAEQRVGQASADAAKVLSDAKDKVAAAAKRVDEAILREADAHAKVVELTKGATKAAKDYIETLKRRAALLDPNSQFRKDLDSYIADLERISALEGTGTTNDGKASLGNDAPPGIINAEHRWGGIDVAFGAGGTTPAHITGRTRIKYGEPGTGGEAYVPRLGDYGRSTSILDIAAGWYGGSFVPHSALAQRAPMLALALGSGGLSAADVVAIVEAMNRPNVNVDARGSHMDPDTVVRRARHAFAFPRG